MSAPMPTPPPRQSPLTCIMPIKSAEDFRALSALLPAAKPAIDQALDVIGTVHFARFVFLGNNTQLAIITTYDGDFNRYIADFAQHIGPVFDQLFQHISDAPPLPVNKNVDDFVKYVFDHDVKATAFYSAYPQLTVLDIKAAARS
jgi:hypothetical protein